MLPQGLKSRLLTYFPSGYRRARDAYHGARVLLGPRGRQLRAELAGLGSPEQVFEFAHTHIRPYQIASEILALVAFLSERRPGVYLEIGTANGGTHFLIRRLCPALRVSIAIDIDIHNRHLIDLLTATPETHYIEGASTDPCTRRRLERVLAGRQIDALFIDGDHSYEGVKQDFDLYRGHVRPGGAIIFHDIVADHGQRYGKQTNKYTGGVPRFFAEIKNDFECFEFVEDYDQDGFGIGVILT